MIHLARMTIRRPRVALRPTRLGLTLTELLVVIVVLMILASITVGALRPTLEGAQVREAARTLSSMFATAKYRAQRNGRAAGIMLEPLNDGKTSLNIVPVEDPPPYGGMTAGATVTFTDRDFSVDAEMTATPTFSDGRTIEQLDASGVIGFGDRWQFNYRGHMFVSRGVKDGKITFRSFSTHPQWPSGTPLPFLVYRRPRPSSAPAVQLPQGAVVDLTASGWGSQSTFTPSSKAPVIVMFSPAGHVERVFERSTADPAKDIASVGPKAAPLQFLVGRIDQISKADSGGLIRSKNLGDLENRWVTVNTQTGMVRTYEMAAVYENQATNRSTNPVVSPSVGGSIYQSRKLTRREYVPPQEDPAG